MLEIIDLIQSTPEQLSRFKIAVEKVGHKATFLMHPYHHEDRPGIRMFHRPLGFELRRDRFIKACLDSGSPLIIGEARSEYHLLRSRIGPHSFGNLYTVRTVDNNPLPLIGNYTDDRNWSNLADILQQANVKHLVVGGIAIELFTPSHYLGGKSGKLNRELLRVLTTLRKAGEGKIAAARWLEKGLIPNGCAGTAAERLLNAGFDVSISPISSPSNRLEALDYETTLTDFGRMLVAKP